MITGGRHYRQAALSVELGFVVRKCLTCAE